MDIYSILEKNGIFVVLIIAFIVFAGIFLYTISLGSKVSKLEKENN